MNIAQLLVFCIVLAAWFGGLYFFVYKKGDKKKIKTDEDESEEEKDGQQVSEDEDGDAFIGGNEPNVVRRRGGVEAARARAEEEKLDRQEIENNRAIQEMEKMLKDSNRAGLTKKEVQKMEKKLEKCQQQAARLAMQREMRE